jgi:hypothetical protein
VDGERVHPGSQIVRKNSIDHAVAVNPGLPFEGRGHNINPEVGLPARPRAGMAFVLVGFVNHVEAFRRESLGQFLRKQIGCSHISELGNGIEAVNGLLPPESCCPFVVKT